MVVQWRDGIGCVWRAWWRAGTVRLLGRFVVLVVTLVLSVIAAGAVGQEPVTFTRDVAPILFRHCVPCHREGGIGPFGLGTYAEASERSERIAEATDARAMPPWLPAPGSERFTGERRLSAEEIGILRRWADGGAEEGNPAELPPPPEFASGWQLGEPDLVVAMPEPYAVPASGGDIFRSFVAPVPTRRDRFVRALEFQPGIRSVVHHAVVLVDRARSTRALDSLDPEPGWAGMQSGLAESPAGHFLGWTPGRTALETPPGLAWRLPAGSDLVLQLHLLPRRDAAPVRMRVGFHFTEEAPTRASTRIRLGAKTMDIPAGEADYRIRDAYRFPVDVELLALYPHAHYIGREMRVWVQFENGGRRTLLHIPAWDFDWQAEYRFERPVALPAGARLAMEFRYDNSDGNPRNPHDPPRRVLYGPESSDEMGDLWVQVVPRRSEDLAALNLDFARKETAARLAGYRFKLDRNPADEIALYGLAGMLAELGERAEAIRRLETLVGLRPDFALALSELGRLHSLNGNRDRAAALFTRAVEASPELPQAHHNLGALRLGEGDPAGAEAHFRRALGGWPEFAEAHFGLGEALARRGQTAQALEHFRRAVAAKPDFVAARFRLGNLLARRGNDEAALVHFRAAADDLPEALFNQAAVLARLGRFDEAKDSVRRLLERHPDHRRAAELLERLSRP